MKTIDFSEYEIGKLDRYLERLKVYVANDEPTDKRDNWDDRPYDLEQIDLLLERVRGRSYKPDYLIQTSEYKSKLSNKREEKEERGIIEIKQW